MNAGVKSRSAARRRVIFGHLGSTQRGRLDGPVHAGSHDLRVFPAWHHRQRSTEVAGAGGRRCGDPLELVGPSPVHPFPPGRPRQAEVASVLGDRFPGRLPKLLGRTGSLPHTDLAQVTRRPPMSEMFSPAKVAKGVCIASPRCPRLPRACWCSCHMQQSQAQGSHSAPDVPDLTARRGMMYQLVG
jgi:hypothetical protein